MPVDNPRWTPDPEAPEAVTKKAVGAIQILNPNVDYLVTDSGEYIAHIKARGRTLGNRLPPGLTPTQLEEFLRTTQPIWAKTKSRDPQRACLAALKELFGVDAVNITSVYHISSDDKGRFLELVIRWGSGVVARTTSPTKT